MTLKEAYETGFETGYSIAESNWYSTGPNHNSIEEFISYCLETESDHYRKFSPFEFTAKEFNDSRNPDRTWERYEDGVHKGILAYIKDTPKK